MDNIDKTIDAICNWIQKRLEDEKNMIEPDTAEMTHALAALVSARGKEFNPQCFSQHVSDGVRHALLSQDRKYNRGGGD